MTREEMREKVAALLNADCFEGCEPGPDEMRACVYPPCRCRTVADAAIAIIRAEVLEEAASTIETRWQHGVGDHYAAAIRALKEGK